MLRDLKIRGLLPQMDQADDAKFDLVAMLFDYFLNDEQLPFALRDRIACLQIPLLKTAFIDNNFFVLKTHPARQLLNTITRIGVESAGAPASLAVLLDSVDRVVQRIHDEFSEDVSLFAVLQMQLERDTAIARHEVVAGGQCAVPAAPDQPRHEEAKRKIRTLIDSRLDHISPIAATIPEVVRNFILTHWQHLLIRHFIREGGNGDLLNEAIHTMDDLIRSTTTARNASDLLQLRQLRPVLIRRLETGMDVLALPSIARNGFLERLAKCHAEVLGPESDVNTGPETISEDASLAIAAALFEDVPPSMSTRPDPEEITTPREVYLKTAKAQLPPAPASSPSTEESGSKDIHMKL